MNIVLTQSIKGVNGFADDSWFERPPMLRPSVRLKTDWQTLNFGTQTFDLNFSHLCRAGAGKFGSYEVSIGTL